MPSTVTTPIHARVPHDQAAAFRAQAERYGLTTSSAIAALVAGALAVDPQPQQHEREDTQR